VVKLCKTILPAQNHRGKIPESGGESMWSADFNDAPNLVDEALAEVHQLKKDSNQRLAALESKFKSP
jgi:hypothetical protein